LSASHNPNEWNALKLLNKHGEFMTPVENKQMLESMDQSENKYATWDKLGKVTQYPDGLTEHMNAVLSLPQIDVEKIREQKFKVVLDCVNGAGSWIMPQLLERLGCEVIKVNCEKNGVFPRLPEPLPENLVETMEIINQNNVELGIVVDPDVDRLVLLTEKGEPFGEENTIVQATRFALSKEKGNVVANLSTTRAVDDMAFKFGCEVFRSPVGEANVVNKMKEVNAVIGGEGSGGVIYPALHYGRDALVGTVMILQQLAEYGDSISEFKKEIPEYFIRKSKVNIGNSNPDLVIDQVKEKYKAEKVNDEDGVRVDFDDHWVHFRKSNTEPIIRCIVEAETKESAEKYIDTYFNVVADLVK
jgi:phosphomannomutase